MFVGKKRFVYIDESLNWHTKWHKGKKLIEKNQMNDRKIKISFISLRVKLLYWTNHQKNKKRKEK